MLTGQSAIQSTSQRIGELDPRWGIVIAFLPLVLAPIVKAMLGW